MPGKARKTYRFGTLFTAMAIVGGMTTSVTAQQADTIQVAADEQTQTVLRDAQSLLAAGQSDRAYSLLMPHEAALAGNPYYDYLLGVAALDSGRTSEAVFSLRRSLAVEPGFSGARMELARAYFESGNRDLARPLFVQLLTEDPPPAVNTVINDYIRAIDARPAIQRSRWNPYLELFVGHDDNANGSTSDQDFLGFMLSPNNVKTASSFAEIAAGLDWYKPANSQFAWLMNLKASHRSNPDASFVDASILSGLFGANWQRDAWFGRAAVEAYWGSRDGSYNESYAGLDLLFGRRLGQHWDLTLGLRGGGLKHRDFLEVLDVNRVLYSLGTSYRFDNSARINVQAIGGNDSEQQQGSPYGNSKAGGRISLSAPVGARSLLYASLGSLTTDYDGLFFGESREDQQLTGLLQLEFRDVLTKGLMFVPRVRYIDNDSDVDLYTYDRLEYGLIIRWAPR
jgi:tetratricopeptide (TPR) repeat protein